jgi:hypothetical protein
MDDGFQVEKIAPDAVAEVRVRVVGADFVDDGDDVTAGGPEAAATGALKRGAYEALHGQATDDGLDGAVEGHRDTVRHPGVADGQVGDDGGHLCLVHRSGMAAKAGNGHEPRVAPRPLSH